MSEAGMVAGEEFVVQYPFVRVKVTLLDEDEDGRSGVEVDSWQPGTRNEHVYPDDCEAVADGLGVMTLTVVSTHKPGRYPLRVFFTRTFTTPEGKTFGKTKLHIVTAEKFRRISSSYQHPFELKTLAGAR